MDAISLKLDEKMLVHMDETLKEHDYSTRTEFVRDAIREKLVSLERERLIQSFLRLRGKAKKRTSMSDREIRELASEELLVELERRFT